MNIKEDKKSVGVIVARFQVPYLTSAHEELITAALEKHSKVLIFLGLSPVKATISNPLDYQPRRQMVMEAFPPELFPQLSVNYIKDVQDDNLWSANLDKLIEDQIQVNDTVLLYGGRDSFLSLYKGKFPSCELFSPVYVSGTEIRKKVSEAPQSNASFRAGAIWASYQKYPTVYPTVDIIIQDVKENKVLLAKKPNEHYYRFVGGFVQPSDNSYEEAALRELYEETALTVGLDGLKYIGSAKVDDWRYRNEVDKIITHLYLGYYIHGSPRAGDDISEVRWFELDRINEGIFVPEHRILFKMFKDYLEKNKKKE